MDNEDRTILPAQLAMALADAITDMVGYGSSARQLRVAAGVIGVHAVADPTLTGDSVVLVQADTGERFRISVGWDQAQPTEDELEWPPPMPPRAT